MTTEDDFQRQLDARPDDWQTRLVLADYLEERGDPRAEGYRALGRRRVRPHDWVYKGDPESWPKRWLFHDGRASSGFEPIQFGVLPADWVLAAVPHQKGYAAMMILDVDVLGPRCNRPATRRQVEDFVARAFSNLSAERRAELLQGPLS